MADLEFFQDINGNGVAQLKSFRVHNIADAAAQAAYELVGNFGSPLGVGNKGIPIYREDTGLLGLWNGSSFIFASAEITGDIVFKGKIDASVAIDAAGQPQVVEYVSGFQYIVSVAGTFDAGSSGVTLEGNQQLEVGDYILFTDTDEAYAIQRNDAEATETELGNIRLATQAEVNAGVQATEAVTSATLQGKLDAEFYVKQYAATVNIPALTPLTVTHNLNLVDRNSFTINTMRGNTEISVDVDSVNTNELTLTSLLAISNVRVTIQGASAV